MGKRNTDRLEFQSKMRVSRHLKYILPFVTPMTESDIIPIYFVVSTFLNVSMEKKLYAKD